MQDNGQPLRSKMTFDEKRRVDNDIRSLKHSLSISKEENSRLKQRVKELEEEVKFKDLHLKKLFNKVAHLFCAEKKPSLGLTAETELKNHVKLTQKEIDKAKKTRDQLANDMKDTALEDAQEELRNSLEECRRLRAMIEAAKTENLTNEKLNRKQLLLENRHLLSIVEKQNYELDKLKGIPRRKERTGLRSCLTELRVSTKTLIATPMKSTTRKNLFNENESKKTSITIIKIGNSEQEDKEILEISEEEKKTAITRLRLLLINCKIPKENVKSLFPIDKMTAEEFEKALKRKPLQVNKDLARNIIATIGYTQFNNQTINNIIKHLISLIPDYNIYEKEVMDKALSNKVRGIELSDKIIGNFVDAEELKRKIKEIGLELTDEECDYLAVVAYKKSKDKKKLQGKAVIQYLRGFCSAKSTEKVDESEVINIDEEKIIEIAHNFFFKFAKKIRSEDISLADLYEDKLDKIEIEGKEVAVFSPEIFLGGLNYLGLELTDSIEYACVIKILALNDDEKLLKYEYLVDIIRDYGVAPEIIETVGDLTRIDDVSLIIILAISEHIVKNKIELRDLLEGKIHVQGTIEVIDSKDFFAAIEKIGVGLEDKEHKQLKELLCIDLANKNILSIAKLKQVVDEFLRNEQLQDRAIKFYEEMARNSQEKETSE